MSYAIIDSAGRSADVATNQGIRELEAFGLPAFKKFLSTGQADAALVARVIAEARAVPELNYVADILNGMEPPVMLTDGVVEDEEAESEGET
jgi:hypothetical protein